MKKIKKTNDKDELIRRLVVALMHMRREAHQNSKGPSWLPTLVECDKVFDAVPTSIFSLQTLAKIEQLKKEQEKLEAKLKDYEKRIFD